MEFRLQEESQRVGHYLSSQTEVKLRGIVENELILTHCKTLLEMDTSGFVCMLRDNKLSDLRRMYTLFFRIPACLEQMREAMGKSTLVTYYTTLLTTLYYTIRREVCEATRVGSAGQSGDEQRSSIVSETHSRAKGKIRHYHQWLLRVSFRCFVRTFVLTSALIIMPVI